MPTQPKVAIVARRFTYLVAPLPGLCHRAGAHVTLICPRAQPYRHSRFVQAWVEVPADPSAAATAVGEHLAQTAPPYDLVVFEDESTFEALATHEPALQCLKWLRPDVRCAVQSKTNFARWAQAQQVPMPAGRVCHGPDDAAEWLKERGPAMLKTNHQAGGTGVRLVRTVEECVSRWEELGRPSEFLMQQFILGRPGVTELILGRGDVIAWFASLQERTFNEHGASSIRRLLHPPGMDELVRKVAAATGFHGLCGFDWIQEKGPEGRLLLIEFHPRTPSGFAWGKYAGVDSPQAVRELLAGSWPVTHGPWPQPQLDKAPLCCYFPEHLLHALGHRPGELRYWLPGSGAISWAAAPFDDPRALLHTVLSHAGRISSKLLCRVGSRLDWRAEARL